MDKQVSKEARKILETDDDLIDVQAWIDKAEKRERKIRRALNQLEIDITRAKAIRYHSFKAHDKQYRNMSLALARYSHHKDCANH